MTEVPKSAGESALRFSTAGEAIAYVGKHNLSRVEADPIFDANEIDRDDAWAMVEKARAAEKVAYFEEGRRAKGEGRRAKGEGATGGVGDSGVGSVAATGGQTEATGGAGGFFSLQHNLGVWKMETRRSCRPRPNLRRRSQNQNQNRRRLYRQ
jgi:hypothetical protein